jgi:hypothetical protein
MKKINYDKFGKGISGIGTFIGNNKKPLLYVGGAIALVVVGYAVVKRLKGAVEGKKIIAGKFNEQDIDPIKLTISKKTAENYAEILFEAFNYDWGTDKGQVENVFNKIKSEDFKLIYNAFGKRDYGTWGGFSPTAVERLLGQFRSLDLVQWLNEELGILDFSLKNKIRPIVDGAGFVLEK